jgi:hypothetical protein
LDVRRVFQKEKNGAVLLVPRNKIRHAIQRRYERSSLWDSITPFTPSSGTGPHGIRSSIAGTYNNWTFDGCFRKRRTVRFFWCQGIKSGTRYSGDTSVQVCGKQSSTTRRSVIAQLQTVYVQRWEKCFYLQYFYNNQQNRRRRWNIICKNTFLWIPSIILLTTFFSLWIIPLAL